MKVVCLWCGVESDIDRRTIFTEWYCSKECYQNYIGEPIEEEIDDEY